MATNFFENQERARGATVRLVIYFCLAVIGVVAAMVAVVQLIFVFTNGTHPSESQPSLFDPRITLITGGLTLVLIIFGTLWRMSQLSQGGATIAEMLGGRRIDPSSKEPDERKLLNIVEEMAIASGMAVPDVYVTEDASINAFAAGHSPKEAVIGVTTGAMRKLTRDELQGVIAHEFSHVFNGDMKLNLRLIGVLAGIQLLGSIGLWILRNVHSGRSSPKKKDDGAGAILVLGLALTVIGYVGVFFARLIKSAVSRQREYLADASAVQYTRNPWGIGMALRKIQSDADGSSISDKHAEEMSHMFFGQALSLSAFFATHPPIESRLQQIDPQLLKAEARSPREPVSASPTSDDGQKKRRAAAAAVIMGPTGAVSMMSPDASIEVEPSALIESVGSPQAAHVHAASSFLNSLPGALLEAAHDAESAKALVLGVFLKGRADETHLAVVRAKASGSLFEQMKMLLPMIEAAGPASRLPLVELCIPALRHVSASERKDLLLLLRDVIWADTTCETFEYAIYTILVQLLVGRPQRSAGTKTLAALRSEASLVLSSLAHEGERRGVLGADSLSSYKAAQDYLRNEGGVTLLPLSDRSVCAPNQIESSLRALATLSPRAKSSFIAAATATVLRDNHLSLGEFEFLQAICAVIDCPLPPLGLPVSA